MTYTRIPAQIQCDGCKKIQSTEHKYCCECGGKFEQVWKPRPEFIPSPYTGPRISLDDLVYRSPWEKSHVTFGEHGTQTNSMIEKSMPSNLTSVVPKVWKYVKILPTTTV